MEKEREREYLRDREYSMPPVEPPVITEKYERDEYSRVEERTYPVPVARNNMRREETQTQMQTQSQSQSQSQKEDTVVAVSGKHRCAHCNEELGAFPHFQTFFSWIATISIYFQAVELQ